MLSANYDASLQTEVQAPTDCFITYVEVETHDIVKVKRKEVKNTTSLLSVNSVVNKTTCFGLFGGHHQVQQVLAVGD